MLCVGEVPGIAEDSTLRDKMVTQIMKASPSKLPESVSRLPPGAGYCGFCGCGVQEAAKNQGGKGVDD
jgi:hypothetical protein